MISGPNRLTHRPGKGMSLIELVFAVAIVGVAAAGIASLVMLNNMSSQRVLNKVQGLDAARNTLERIGMTIREAQNLGDQFDLLPAFPAVGKNPLYGGGQSPAGGWPAMPWPNPPYGLTNQQLVLQVPVCYFNRQNDPRDPAYNGQAPDDKNNGYPFKLDPADPTLNPPISTPYPNVDTIVYQVLPDPDTPTQAGMPPEYILQVAIFPGKDPGFPTRQRPAINPPQTLLKGIVNSEQPEAPPKVFQYLAFVEKSDPPWVTFDAVTTNAANIAGVLVNLEVLRYDRTLQQNDATVGIQSTFYLRNSSAATP